MKNLSKKFFTRHAIVNIIYKTKIYQAINPFMKEGGGGGQGVRIRRTLFYDDLANYKT